MTSFNDVIIPPHAIKQEFCVKCFLSKPAIGKVIQYINRHY
jgi:uncharacterized protein (DUF2132 family)